jgi:hypothetical protein
MAISTGGPTARLAWAGARARRLWALKAKYTSTGGDGTGEGARGTRTSACYLDFVSCPGLSNFLGPPLAISDSHSSWTGRKLRWKGIPYVLATLCFLLPKSQAAWRNSARTTINSSRTGVCLGFSRRGWKQFHFLKKNLQFIFMINEALVFPLTWQETYLLPRSGHLCRMTSMLCVFT